MPARLRGGCGLHTRVSRILLGSEYGAGGSSFPRRKHKEQASTGKGGPPGSRRSGRCHAHPRTVTENHGQTVNPPPRSPISTNARSRRAPQPPVSANVCPEDHRFCPHCGLSPLKMLQCKKVLAEGHLLYYVVFAVLLRRAASWTFPP
jgi:hypothetical protein